MKQAPLSLVVLLGKWALAVTFRRKNASLTLDRETSLPKAQRPKETTQATLSCNNILSYPGNNKFHILDRNIPEEGNIQQGM